MIRRWIRRWRYRRFMRRQRARIAAGLPAWNYTQILRPYELTRP